MHCAAARFAAEQDEIMQKKIKIQYYASAAVLAIVLFALFGIFPLTGDDWYREGLGASISGIGDLVRTVAQKWSTTNGRILGNVLAYTAGSRPIVRDIMRTVITTALAALLARVSGMRTGAGLLLCAAALFSVPRETFREIYPWAAGYFNYVPPVALALGAMALIPEALEGKSVGGGKARCAALFIIGFAAQLFVENVTFYVLCSAGVLNIVQLIRHKKLSSALVCYLIGAIMGAALLLASPSYIDILLNGRSYQMSATGGLSGLIASAKNNCATVFNFLIAGCPVLYISITAVLGFYMLRSKPGIVDFFHFAAMLACCACFMFGKWSGAAISYISLAWFALAAAAIVRHAGNTCVKALYFLLAALCAAFPLLFVNPIGPRCLYASYVFQLAVLLSLISGSGVHIKFAYPVCAALCAAVIALYAWIYYPLHLTDLEQREIIGEAMARADAEVSIPAYSDESWLWEPNNTSKMEYAYYYKSPNDFKIVTTTQETGK